MKIYVTQKTVYGCLYIKAKRWKQPRCSSINEWINKTWYINTMDYYLAKTRNKISIHPIIFHEPWKHYSRWKTQVKIKATFYMTPLKWNIQNSQIYSYSKWHSGCLGLLVSWMIQVLPLKGMRGFFLSFFYDNENALKLIVVMVAWLWEYTKNHQSVRFKWTNCMVRGLYPNKSVTNTYT